MRATWDEPSGKLTWVGQRNQGQPRQWLIQIRYEGSDGRRWTSKSIRSQGRKTLEQIIDEVRDQMLIEYLQDEGVKYLGFTAMAR